MVNELIKAYGLMSHLRMVNGKTASEDDLLSFHSQEYIYYLKEVNERTDLEKEELTESPFGLGM